MVRRRRGRKEIAFSFDSFLDVVANVVGIILRLILVAWVGARSYKAVVPPLPPPPAFACELPTLPEPTDPRLEQIEHERETIAETSESVAARDREGEQAHATAQRLRADLEALAGRQKKLEADQTQLGRVASKRRKSAGAVELSKAELQKRSQALLAEVEKLKKQPPPRKELRYRTPVSAAVQSEEVMFECLQGRVTLIDTGALLAEVRRETRGLAEGLKRQWEVSATTSPVGAFRLRYALERERGAFDGPGAPPADGTFRYALAGWQVEPIKAERGETAERALSEGSDFRSVIDRLDPQQTAVTLWVYPDSFPLYRRLRDYLHDREIVVAGRPLPDGVHIASSRQGSLSRGQ